MTRPPAQDTFGFSMLRTLFFHNGLLIVQYAVTGLVPVLLVPYVVRQIGLSAYGGLAIAIAWATYGSVVVQYAFQLSGPQRLAQLASGDSEKLVVCRVVSAKLVLLSAVLAATTVGATLSGVTTGQLVVLMLLPLAASMNSAWHLQASGRFLELSALSIIGALIALVIGFSFVDGGGDNSAFFAAVALTVGPLFVGVGTLLLSAQRLAGQCPPAAWQSPWAELREGWPLFSSQFCAALYSASGPILIGWLAGQEQAGAYGALERLTNAIAGACLLTHVAAYPKLAILYRTDRRTYLRVIGVVIGVYLLAATLVTLGVLAFWQPALFFLFGTEYAGQELLVLSGLVWLSLGIFGTAYTGYLTVSGQSQLVFPLTLKILALSFLIGVPGVFVWGAWAWLVGLSLAQLLVIVGGWRAWMNETMVMRERAA